MQKYVRPIDKCCPENSSRKKIRNSFINICCDFNMFRLDFSVINRKFRVKTLKIIKNKYLKHNSYT